MNKSNILLKFHEFLCVIFIIMLSFSCTNNQEIKWPKETNESKPWTRWWWQGSAIEKGDIDYVMGKYQEANLGGVEVTPIYGVHGYEDHFKNFLSSEWLDIFVYTLDKAKELDLGVDLANASGWPFGGPWVTPDYACKMIVPKTYFLKEGENINEPITYHDNGFVRLAGHTSVKLEDLKEPIYLNNNLQDLALDQVRYKKELPLVIVTANNDKGVSLDLTSKIGTNGKLDWVAPEGNWIVCALFEGLHGKLVERAGPGGEGDVIDHFASSAIDSYLKKFDDAFRDRDISYLRYYFNDSYEVDDSRGESNWTPLFFEEFKKYRGYDLRLYLPALLGLDTSERNAKVLYDYRKTINDLLIDHYSVRWQQWAAKQGKGIRNQAHGSPANILDLYAVSDVPEIEGEDLVSIKSASSVAHTQGKKLVSSESATWLDEHFQSTLGDVKQALNLFFLGGVNHVFYHGTCFSPENAPWPGWLFYAAVHFTPTNPFWNDFKYLNKYVTRIQSFLQEGLPDNDVLLYYNIADVMSEKGARTLQHFSGLDRNMLNSSVRRSALALTEKGYSWDMISDMQILETSIENNEFITYGGRYKTILVTDTQYIPYETMKKLIDFAIDGGTILFHGDLPKEIAGMVFSENEISQFKKMKTDLVFVFDGNVKHAQLGKGKIYVSTDVEKLMDCAKVKNEKMYELGLECIRKQSPYGKYYFIVNNSSNLVESWVPLLAEDKSAAIFNPMNGKSGVANVKNNDGKLSVFLQLNPGESVIVSTSKNTFVGEPYLYYSNSTIPAEIKNKWSVSFIQGGPKIPTPLTLDSLQSWTNFKGDEYSIFSGTASYITEINYTPKTEMVKLDLGGVSDNASVYLNDKYIGTVLNAPYQLLIESRLFKGNDKLEVRVANSMANRIAYMDKNKFEWKIFYNVNMAARIKENTKDGIFDASSWNPKPSGLLGPVTLTSVVPQNF